MTRVAHGSGQRAWVEAVGAPGWCRPCPGISLHERRIRRLARGLRRILDEPTASQEPLPALPRWNGGDARVDVADRDALYALLDRD